jgi:predicted ester cyclase
MERSPEQVVREHHDCLNRGDPVGAAEFYADEAINQGGRVSRERMLVVLGSSREAFPDFHLEIVELIAVGEVVALRATVTGTHLGVPTFPLMFGGILADVEPTGKRCEFALHHWYRVRDGKIIEHWAVRDDLSVARQLGLLPQGLQREE